MFHFLQALEGIIGSGNLGNLLGFFPILNHNIVQYKGQEFVFSDLSRRFGLHGPDAFIEAARIVNHLTYGEPMIQDKNEEKCVWDPKNPHSRNCWEPDVDKVSKDFIEELPMLSIPFVNERERPNSPKSLLPSCDWDEDSKSCWTRVVTDHGLCFTNHYLNGLLNALFQMNFFG